MDTETLPTAPARRVVTRSPVRTVRRLNLPGIFPHPIECESSLERDFVLRAALNPSVAEIQHQPFRLSSPSGRRYTPDFLLTYADGKHVVVEIKLHRKVEGLRSVFDSAKSELFARGVGFLVLTEREIRRDRAHERAAELLRYRKSGVAPEVRLRLLDCLGAHADGLPINVLAESSGASRIDVLHLIAKRQIAIGKDLAATGESPVYPRNAKESQHEVRTESWFEADLW